MSGPSSWSLFLFDEKPARAARWEAFWSALTLLLLFLPTQRSRYWSCSWYLLHILQTVPGDTANLVVTLQELDFLCSLKQVPSRTGGKDTSKAKSREWWSAVHYSAAVLLHQSRCKGKWQKGKCVCVCVGGYKNIIFLTVENCLVTLYLAKTRVNCSLCVEVL